MMMKRFCCFMMTVVLMLVCFAGASAAAVSNSFVGYVNGEPVIAFFDHSNVTYMSGPNDLDATFVSFDENGQPRYSFCVRIDEHTKERTYSPGNGTKKDYFSIRLEYLPDSLQFMDYYRIVESATDWQVTFTTVNWDAGIVRGKVKATLTPSKYNHAPYPTRSSVYVEGSFEFQSKTIHPVMADYRAMNTDYAEKYDTYFAYSIDSPVAPMPSGNGGSSGQSSQRCTHCSMSGRCNTCGGDGRLDAVSSSFILGNACRTCGGNGRCIWCGGDGLR